MPSTTAITCSYKPDLWRCRRLCRSIDRFLDRSIDHLLIVPKRDLPHFQDLAGTRRRVIGCQELLPRGYRQLPFTNHWWLNPRGFPVRGWIVQQLLKLSADRACDEEVFFIVDSDIQFVKPLNRDQLFPGGKTRLFAIDGLPADRSHRKWQRIAEKLLDLEPGEFSRNYNGPLVTWRRDNLIRLRERIERVTGRPWHLAVGQRRTVSENLLYGIHAERVLAGESLHVADSRLLSWNYWHRGQLGHLKISDINPSQQVVALLIQSNMGLDAERERKLTRHVAIRGQPAPPKQTDRHPKKDENP